MNRVILTILLLSLTAAPAMAASVSRSYSYFSIGGKTLSDIEEQLRTRGPHVRSTGQRHPGATRMEFITSMGYAQEEGRCRIAKAAVSVKARVYLPRWRDRNRAEKDTRLIWDTLSRDIKRHEDSHLNIAKRHARSLEDALQKMPSRKNCERLQEEVQELTVGRLQAHDAAQDRFDRIESINFESRLMRLLNYRLEQIEAGRTRQ